MKVRESSDVACVSGTSDDLASTDNGAEVDEIAGRGQVYVVADRAIGVGDLQVVRGRQTVRTVGLVYPDSGDHAAARRDGALTS